MPTHMPMTTKLALPALLCLLATSAGAKLPPPSDEAKAKAAEAAAKTAYTGKLDTYKLCLAMDRVAAGYLAAAKKAGKAASAPMETPACSDPGPFVYTPPETRPLEASGAHSPAATAAAPPSTTTPAAALPAKK